MEEIIESHRESLKIQKELEFLKEFESRIDDEFVTRGELKSLAQCMVRFIEYSK